MWTRWPFGVKPATGQFQKVMEIVLDGCSVFVVIFLDDVCVFSNTSLEQHIEHLKAVLSLFNRHNLKLNINKCKFGYTRVLLLGHVVSGESRELDPKKANQLLEWVKPTTGKQMMAFLGFINYLRDYVPNCAEVCAPLEELRHVKKFELNEIQNNAFETLVKLINGAPVLSNPDFTYEFYVATDASQFGVGAVLYQVINSEIKYIKFFSKALATGQRNYSATKRELLAVVSALKAFNYYLYGRRFTLFTDHSALVAINTKSELSYVMSNWLDVLLQYDFDICHRPGVELVLPDKLSRMFLAMRRARSELDSVLIKPQEPQTLEVKRITVDELTKQPDQELANFINERLLKKTLASEEKRLELVRQVHSKGHYGAEKIYKELWALGYYWPGMRRMCQNVVNSCRPCLQFNIGKEGFRPMQSLRADAPMDHICVDCAVNLPESEAGYKHVLIVVDLATRFLMTMPLKSMTMEELSEKLYLIICLFGPPKIMQSDNGTEFVNELCTKLLKAANVDHRMVAGYNPRANGLVERMVQTVKQVLRKKLESAYDRWDQVLLTVTHAINTTTSRAFKSSPFSLFFGREANPWVDYRALDLQLQCEVPNEEQVVEQVLENSAIMREVVLPAVHEAAYKTQDKRNKDINKKRLIREPLAVNDLVMIKDVTRTSSAEPRWLGPFIVHRVNKRGTYKVKDLAGNIIHRSIPISQIKPNVYDGPLTDAAGDVVEEKVGEQERYVVQNIIDDRKTVNGESEYLVKWRGFSVENNSWEPASAFDDAATIANYWRKKRKNNSKQKN